MAAVNLRSLANKFNPTCLRALEGAAGLCLSRSNYNVEIEHLVLKLLETANTDLTRICRHYEVNPTRVNS
jgi:type VI secretion system protein VasG